jgi:hypothetical protein
MAKTSERQITEQQKLRTVNINSVHTYICSSGTVYSKTINFNCRRNDLYDQQIFTDFFFISADDILNMCVSQNGPMFSILVS